MLHDRPDHRPPPTRSGAATAWRWAAIAVLLVTAGCTAGRSTGPREPSAPGVDAWTAYAPPANPEALDLATDAPAGLRVTRVTTSAAELTPGGTAEVTVWITHDGERTDLGVSPAFADPAFDGDGAAASGEGREIRLEATRWDPAVQVESGEEAAVSLSLRALEPGDASFGLIVARKGKPVAILPVFEVTIGS